MAIRAVAPVCSGKPSEGRGQRVLVAGAAGGVGQLTCANLLRQGYAVRAVVRGDNGSKVPEGAEVVRADLRDSEQARGLAEGAEGCISCMGTTAFPTKRWKGGGPEQTDFQAVSNLVGEMALHGNPGARFVLVSSAGVESPAAFPQSLLNLFGVLTWKRRGEMELERSNLNWAILRPGRLIGGPWTSYDLNTLLRASDEGLQGVRVLPGTHPLPRETSRAAVASAAIAALACSSALFSKFVLASERGSASSPASLSDWEELFARAQAPVWN